MNDDKLLGCLGILIGIVVVVVLGWMSFELLLAIGAGGSAAITDPIFHHDAGELLVVGLVILGIYTLVFRPLAMAGLLTIARPLLWAGALLNLLAWVRVPAGTRLAGWMLVLAALGAVAPWLLAFFSRRAHPNTPDPRMH